MTKRPASLPPSPLARILGALLAVVTVLTVAGAAWVLSDQRAQLLSHAELRASAGAGLLEEHVLRTFGSTDFVLDQVAELALSHPLDEIHRSKSAFEALRRIARGLPEPGTLWIIAPDGSPVLGTVEFPPPRTDLGDRYYFTAHKRERLEGLVVGPLVNTKSRGLQAFHISKRVDGPDGSLLAVVAAGADAQYYTDFYHSLGLGPGSNILIADLAGRMIFRQPDPEKWVEKSILGGPLMQAAKANPNGVARGGSPLDGTERIVAYRTVARYGVIVACGVAVADVLAPWYDNVAAATIIVVVAIAFLGAIGRLAFRSLGREEALLAGLEERVRERTSEATFQAEEARRANETKTRFLAAASHDLRQPLQAAGMFVEVLEARLGDSPHRPVLDKLRQGIEATQTLLTTLLDASTLEAGRVEPNQMPIPLLPMMASLMDQMEPEAALKGLRLLAAPTDAWVISDPVLLERMVRNLLVNALRYTDKGGVLLGCRRRGNSLVLQVVDTGPGIPEDKLDAIFEDFTRFGDRGSGSSRGLGLGLAVVRRMAALLGHGLEVRSTVGRGSSFGIVLPLAHAGQARRTSPCASPAEA